MVQALYSRGAYQIESEQDIHHQAGLLVLSTPNNGYCLRALPIPSCGLQLYDDAVVVDVGLRLGARLCEPHMCPCGANVDPEVTHVLACNNSTVRTARLMI